jgi:deoxyribonuclease-1
MKIMILIVTAVLLLSGYSQSEGIHLTIPPTKATDSDAAFKSPTSFSKAKRHMYDIYRDVGKTFYCGCSYKGRKPDVEPDCYTPVKPNNIRDTRTEAEHILPAAIIGQSFACWAEAKKIKGVSGRKHCYRTDLKFRDAHNDPTNLAPIVGGPNAYRGSLDYGYPQWNYYNFGACQLFISKGGPVSERRVLPPKEIRGDVARVYDHMRFTHGLTLNAETLKMMAVWKKNDPISTWERERKIRLERVLGPLPYYLPKDKKKPIINKNHPDSILEWLRNIDDGYRQL